MNLHNIFEAIKVSVAPLILGWITLESGIKITCNIIQQKKNSVFLFIAFLLGLFFIIQIIRKMLNGEMIIQSFFLIYVTWGWIGIQTLIKTLQSIIKRYFINPLLYIIAILFIISVIFFIDIAYGMGEWLGPLAIPPLLPRFSHLN